MKKIKSLKKLNSGDVIKVNLRYDDKIVATNIGKVDTIENPEDEKLRSCKVIGCVEYSYNEGDSYGRVDNIYEVMNEVTKKSHLSFSVDNIGNAMDGEVYLLNSKESKLLKM